MTRGTVVGARQRQRDLRAPDLDREGRRPGGAEGHRRPRVYATSSTRSSASPASARGAPQKTVYDPAADKTLPEGHVDQPEPRPAVDRGAAGAHRSASTTPRQARRRRRRDAETDAAATATRAGSARRRRQRRRPPTRTKRSTSCCGTGRTRACSRSRKSRNRATAPSATSPSIASQPKKFVRLADDELRTVNVAPKQNAGRSARRPRVRADGQPRRPPLPGRLRRST